MSLRIHLLVASVVAFGVHQLFKRIREELTSPIRDFPGPPGSSLLFGNTLQIFGPEQWSLGREWVTKYGRTMQFKGMLWRGGLYMTDLKAINHVLMNNYTYRKPEAATYNLRKMLGEGVLLTEGDVHKNQRKILNPAFGPLQIRELTTIFVEKAIKLRDVWASKVRVNDGEVEVDALSWLIRMTLDVIGEAGFGYDFGSLSEESGHQDELWEAFGSMFKVGPRLNPIVELRGMFPVLRILPTDRDVERGKARKIMDHIGRQLLEERKRATVSSKGNKDGNKDLLSLLVHANTATDIPEHRRMSDEDVIAQIPTFMVAGHETTSTGTTWALYALAKDKKIQEKLREELLTVPIDNPTMEVLNSLQYLDAVVREALRLYPPVSGTLRAAAKEDILPLESPVIDRKGKMHDHIKVTKGQNIVIPISIINTLKDIWGEDALEFNPSRWNSVPPAASGTPGVWGNMLTFLGGPRACIGYRFALVEMKALLFALIRTFEFELAVPQDDIVRKSELITRPVLRNDPKSINQLPVKIRLATLR